MTLPRILFVCEAVTLAHVARPAQLAASLDTSHYDVHLARNDRYGALVGELTGVVEHELFSISPAAFHSALDEGKPVYDFDTLCRYVEDDRDLIDRVKPDLIVGDFRLSLSVSARLANVPYATLSNAYWSPHTVQRFPVPGLPLTRVVPPVIAQPVFRAVRPLAFALHCLPMARLCRKYGLGSPGYDLLGIYTDADYTLFVDVPGLYNQRGTPTTHRFLGPLNWSPAVDLPQDWLPVDKASPLVYATVGSSGSEDHHQNIIPVLGELPATGWVSTAGAKYSGPLPDNVRIAPFLPGDECSRLADVVLCNGGSPTSQQALAHGKPVVGIANNLDQYLNMQLLEQRGVARLVRADRASPDSIRAALTAVLDDSGYAERARKLALEFRAHDACSRFSAFVDEIMSSGNLPRVESESGSGAAAAGSEER